MNEKYINELTEDWILYDSMVRTNRCRLLIRKAMEAQRKACAEAHKLSYENNIGATDTYKAIENAEVIK